MLCAVAVAAAWPWGKLPPPPGRGVAHLQILVPDEEEAIAVVRRSRPLLSDVVDEDAVHRRTAARGRDPAQLGEGGAQDALGDDGPAQLGEGAQPHAGDQFVGEILLSLVRLSVARPLRRQPRRPHRPTTPPGELVQDFARRCAAS